MSMTGLIISIKNYGLISNFQAEEKKPMVAEILEGCV